MQEEFQRQHLEFQLRVLQSISHDIRTNLNEIQGYLAFLQKRELQENESEYLIKAKRATQALRYSVDKMLSFSSLSAADLQLERRWFSLQDLAIDVSEFVSEAAAKKDLEAKIAIQIATQKKLYGDVERLEEMLRYLLENAVKFTEEGFVSLELSAKEVENDMELDVTIRDSGIGMSPAEIQEAFEPYVRLAPTHKGVGLGLYFSRMIVEKMGGTLKIDSVPKEGTSVHLKLRFDLEREETNEYSILSGKQLILFCDRRLGFNREVQRLNIQGFKDLGMEVECFYDEEAFIQHLISGRTTPADLISISTMPEDYNRFGLLFAFLKKSRLYSHTVFVAERLGSYLLPEHFDTGFERHAGVGGYLECLKLKQQKKPTEGLHILLVDDLASNLEILRLFLGQIVPEARIDTALGGYEAIGMYKTNRYDLIFLDLKMPGLDGFEVLERLEEIAPLPPVYAVTAEVYEDTRRRIESSAFQGLLEKPLNAQKLKKVIKEIESETDH